jgi:CrcB protein
MLGTGLVNFFGSFMLGVVVSLCTVGGKPNAWGLLLGVGFCGGLTTFSTLAMELADLMHAKRHWEMLGLGLGSLILGIAAFAAGLWIASKA